MALSSRLPGYCHQTVAGEGDPRRPAPRGPRQRVLGGAGCDLPVPAPLPSLPAAPARRARPGEWSVSTWRGGAASPPLKSYKVKLQRLLHMRRAVSTGYLIWTLCSRRRQLDLGHCAPGNEPLCGSLTLLHAWPSSRRSRGGTRLANAPRLGEDVSGLPFLCALLAHPHGEDTGPCLG